MNEKIKEILSQKGVTDGRIFSVIGLSGKYMYMEKTNEIHQVRTSCGRKRDEGMVKGLRDSIVTGFFKVKFNNE